jgi:hypothetical protein
MDPDSGCRPTLRHRLNRPPRNQRRKPRHHHQSHEDALADQAGAQGEVVAVIKLISLRWALPKFKIPTLAKTGLGWGTRVTDDPLESTYHWN